VPATHVTVETPIEATPRVRQVCGLFDLALPASSRLEWSVDLPLETRPWNIGLIVGPSGCGKSTIARHLFAGVLKRQEALDTWPADRSILDCFPEQMPIKEIVALLSSVGFSSPPAWLRPFAVLSTGQQFRARLARLLASCPDLAVMDEYTSVVDRTVAQIGSAALAKTVRQRGQRFVAVTCHEDVAEWLQPDWVYRPAECERVRECDSERAKTPKNVSAPATDTALPLSHSPTLPTPHAPTGFAWRSLQRRPGIALRLFRCRRPAWRLFHSHHYLSGSLAPGAVCFLATWQDRPVAFSAWLSALTRQGGKREHRTVTLPDYQGAGIGMALSGFCAALWKALGQRATSTTTHPAFIAARLRSADWRLIRRPALAGVGAERRPRKNVHHALTRLTAGFEYIGPALDATLAHRLLESGDAS
jgi:energy-coupling factor transporter ATP-binding protein EcfA2